MKEGMFMLKFQDDYTTLITTFEDFILLVYTIMDDWTYVNTLDTKSRTFFMQTEQLHPQPAGKSYIQVYYESFCGYTRILYNQRWLVLPL